MTRCLTLTLLIVLLSFRVSSADLFLDNFESAFPINPRNNVESLIVRGGTWSSDTATQTGLADVLGGYRKVDITTASINDATSTTLRVNSGNSGNLSVSYGVNTVPAAFSFEYGNNGLNGNFSAYDQFVIPVLSSDFIGLNQADLTITLTSGAGTGSVATQSASVVLNENASAHTYTLAFSAFNTINFADVDNVVFSFQATQSPDFTISSFSISAVPEPSSLVLTVLVSLGFIGVRRRSVGSC